MLTEEKQRLLRTYNENLLDNYFFEPNAQKIVMTGMFNGDFILFVGSNPGLLKNHVPGDMEYTEAFEVKDLDRMNSSYIKALKSSAGTLGIFLNDIWGDNWDDISFTNVVKTPFNNNNVSFKDDASFHFHTNVLKEQIMILKPQTIIAIGKLAERALHDIKIHPHALFVHPSFLRRTSQYDFMVKRYKMKIDILKENKK